MLPVTRSADQRLRGGCVLYIKRRAWRILPPYYAALVLALAVAAFSPQGLAWLHGEHHPGSSQWLSNFSAGNVVSHVFVLHNLSERWATSLDMALWSIATEWQIYFFFPLLLLPVWRKFGAFAAVVAGFAFGMAPHVLLPHGKNFDWACPWYLGLFALGMTCAVLLQRGVFGNKRAALLPWTTLLFAGLYFATKLLYAGSEVGENDPVRWLKDALAGFIAASVILSCAVAANGGGNRLLRVFEHRRLVGLGTWSYSLYLTHCLVLQEMLTMQRFCHFFGVTALLLRVLVGIPASLALAYLFFLVFERPFLSGRNSFSAAGRRQNSVAEAAHAAAIFPAP
jgi:peptidoglycan/LPS O-acetylase OafA/YrhL